jgi:hypothetical protein
MMGDGLLAVVMAVIIEFTLIQRLKKLRMEVIVPIQAMDVFALDLCTSRTFMLFLCQ